MMASQAANAEVVLAAAKPMPRISRARYRIVALTLSPDLFISAKQLLIYASDVP